MSSSTSGAKNSSMEEKLNFMMEKLEALENENRLLKSKLVEIEDEDRQPTVGERTPPRPPTPARLGHFQTPLTVERSAELVEMMVKSSAKANIKAPTLGSWDKNSVKNFKKEYEDYLLHFGEMTPKPQEFIRGEYLDAIVDFHGSDRLSLKSLSVDDFFKSMCAVFQPFNSLEGERVMRTIRMKDDSAELSTLLKYKSEWKFEHLCLGGVNIKAKRLAKIFVEGLRPKELQNLVRAYEPETVDEAYASAKENIAVVRYTNAQSKLMKHGSAGADYKTRGDDAKEENGNEKVKKFNSYNNGYGRRQIKCFKCNRYGHKQDSCPDSDKKSSTSGNSSSSPSSSSHGAVASSSSRPNSNPTSSSSSTTISTSAAAKSRRIVLPITYSMVMEDSEQQCNQHDDGLHRVKGVVNGFVSNVLLDTGANVNIISSHIFNKLNLDDDVIPVESKRINLAAGDIVDSIIGKINMNVDIYIDETRKEITDEFLILKDANEEMIIGYPAINTYDLFHYLKNPLSIEQCEEDELLENYEKEVEIPIDNINSDINDNDNNVIEVISKLDICDQFPGKIALTTLLSNYSEVFGPLSEEGMKVPPMEVKVKDGAVLKSQPCRFVSPKLMPALKVELDQYLLNGIIKRAEVAEVSSPLVLVKKPDGNIRVAVDYRNLNQVLVPYAGSIPDMKSLFNFVLGNHYFAKVDNLWGYFQLNIVEEDQVNTTITTPFGLFKFTKCPFGLSTAPGVYQDRMANVVLKDLVPECAVVYIDDTIIYGKTVEEFLLNLGKVLERMKVFNVKLKPSKCSFGYSSVNFVGHYFSSGGYSLSQERKDGILKLVEPRNIKELRKVIGLINFFRDFIPNLSSIIKPLTELTGIKEFKWSRECNEAWIEVKQAVVDAGMLYSIEDEGKLTVYTDASIVGVGGVLKQYRSLENREVPIMFVSKKFSIPASRWATIEQECFAVFFTLMKLRPLLLGRKFYVATDHRNLLYLQSSSIPKLVRWRLRLGEFDFQVLHIPGRENIIADTLSRLNTLVVLDSDTTSITTSNANDIQGVDVNVNVDHVNEDEDIIKSFHNSIVGHHGIDRVVKMLKVADVEMKNMKQKVKDVISKCVVCQKIKLQPIPIVRKEICTLQGSHPMKRVAVDAVGPLPMDVNSNQYILVVIDEFSKFVNLFACKSVEAMEYINALVHHISVFGLMEQVRTDGATQFTANICQELMKFLGIKHFLITPYHPQSNGIVERRNAEVMKHLRAIVMEHRVKDKWSNYLPIVQNILNNTFDFSINNVPMKLIFGEGLKSSLEWIINRDKDVPIKSTNVYVKEMNQIMNVICENSLKYIKKKFEDKKNKVKEIIEDEVTSFNIGEYVLITYPIRPPSKLSPIYRGPLIIVEQVHENIFKCQDIISKKILELNVDRLRKFNCSSDIHPNELIEWASVDYDEFIVEDIVEHRGTGKRGDPLEFRIHWSGYGPDEDSWLPYKEVRDLEALDRYEEKHPDLLKFQNKKKKKKEE